MIKFLKTILTYLVACVAALLFFIVLLLGGFLALHNWTYLSQNVYHFIHEDEQQRNMSRLAESLNFDAFENDKSISVIRVAGKARMAVLVYHRRFSDYRDVTFVFDDGTWKRFSRAVRVNVQEHENYFYRILKFSDDESGIKINSEGPFKCINNVDSPEFRKWQEETYISFRNSIDEIMQLNGYEAVK